MMGRVQELLLRDSSINDEFTFIPYGLDSHVAKEAVKVHVLHGRKRKVRSRSGQDKKLQVPGLVLEWDSKVEAHQRPSPGSCVKRMALIAQPPGQCPRPHTHTDARQALSLDHEALRNPFVEQLKDDFGLHSALKVRSANFLVDRYLARCGNSKFPQELLSVYWQDTASFKAFLIHAATLYTLETGLLPPVNADQLMCDALQEVNKCLSDPIKKHANGTLLAVAILANVEEGRRQHHTANLHWKGLKQLLNVRGSLIYVRTQRDLHTMLLWREILTSTSDDVCLGHGIEDDPSRIQWCNEHLVAFFDAFTVRLKREELPEIKDDGARSFLASVGIRSNIHQCNWTSSMQARAEIACLTYLAMLIAAIDSSPEARRQLHMLKDDVVQREKWGPVGQPELLFTMLQHGDRENLWRVQQLWQLSRCVFMTRSLALKDWKTVRDMLSWYVGVSEGCDARSAVLSDWKVLSRQLLQNCCRENPDGCHATGWATKPEDEA